METYIDIGTTNFRVFLITDDGNEEVLGVAKITMPDLSHPKISVSGSGIIGTYEVPVTGHFEAMTATFEFSNPISGEAKLLSNECITVEARANVLQDARSQSAVKNVLKKWVFKGWISNSTLGEIASASTAGGSFEMCVTELMMFADGVLSLHIAPKIGTAMINGVDAMEQERRNLGYA